ncbi:MAG: hypothetical protein QNJ41_11090 [Xenococcaceae cyanobacterium MO_188.B32]|nr:hypothetical protein [Xenococcaceae cyanobacterium MO_188.B32]
MNRRPSASDWCEFPHSLDYSFTLDVWSLGGGRYVTGSELLSLFTCRSPITSLCTFFTQVSKAWLKITLSI